MNSYAVYSKAYAVGYYYGRAYPRNDYTVMPAHDLVYRSNQGFVDGLAAGRRDYEDIDLPLFAESTESYGFY